MNTTYRVRLARIAAQVGAICVSHGSPALAQSRVDPLPARLDHMFVSIDSTTTPGCVVGVSRAGLPVLYRTYGVTDLERPTPIDTATVFEAGSVSKQFVAAAVLLLSYEGKLSLDDDIRRFLPEFPTTSPRTTIRQLLTHQSGLRDYGDLLEYAGWPRGTRIDTQLEVLSLIARQSGRNFTPGTEYSYSNSNYAAAVVLVARAAGEPFTAYTQRAVFAPLGMTHTQWRDDMTRRVAGRAIGFTPDDDGVWKIDMPYENVIGAGGLLTTLPDLMRWQAAFRTSALGAHFATDMERAGVLTNGRTTGYALGLELATERGQRTVSHGGWTAGYKSYVGRIPAHDLAVALLCNAGSLRTDELGPKMLALADGDSTTGGDDEPPALGPVVTTGAGADFAGLFRNERTRQPITVRAFRDGLTINTWIPFRQRDSVRFVSADGGRVLTASRRADHRVSVLRIVYDGVDSITFTRVATWSPNSAQLAALAGEYRSVDVDLPWHLAIDHDSLVVRRRDGQRDVLVPRYTDAFTAPSQGWLVTLRRDRAGRLTGFDVGLQRTRTVTFRRTVASTASR